MRKNNREIDGTIIMVLMVAKNREDDENANLTKTPHFYLPKTH